MRLDFNVLWVEDLQDNVQAQKQRLERLVKNEGFRLQVRFAASVAEALEYLSDDIFSDHIDLILMDYNLGPGPNGDKGLIEIRSLMPYKEIVFYSAQAANSLRDILIATNVNGVYLSTREDLPETASGVFDTLVKKVIDIDHSRGIVMGTTSDIDHFVNECLTAIFDRCGENARLGALAIIQKHMKEKRKDFEKNATKVEQVTHVSELFDKHTVYTSVDRLNLLRKIFETNDLYSDKWDNMKDYVPQIIQKRNDLAHVQVKSEGGFSRKFFNKKGEELTSKDMKELRLKLLDYQEMFEKLVESVKTLPLQ